MEKEILERLIKGRFIEVSQCYYSKQREIEAYEIWGRDIGATMDITKEEYKYLINMLEWDNMKDKIEFRLDFTDEEMSEYQLQELKGYSKERLIEIIMNNVAIDQY